MGIDLDETMAALRKVEVLAALDDAALQHVASAMTHVRVAGGEVLYSQGDPADAVAVLCRGRLRVVSEVEGATLPVTELTAGALLGELAVMARRPRSATVEAVRDSDLLLLERDVFDDLVVSEPGLGAAVARSLAGRLQRSRDLVAPTREVAVVSLVSLDEDAATRALAGPLTSALDALHPAVLVRRAPPPAQGPDFARELHAMESGGNRVVLLADEPTESTEWTDFCLRSSDKVVLVSSGRGVPAWARAHARMRHRDIALRDHAPPGVMARIAADVEARALHRIRADSIDADVARLARRLVGRSVGVVLSGGGARGLAHVGALAALRDAGVRIDRIGGTSMGAFVAAMAARGWSPEQIEQACRAELVERQPFTDYTLPRRSVIRGARARAMLARLFGDRSIEELALPFFAVSADLLTGHKVVHRRGPLVLAVASSMAIPGLLPGVASGGRMLVDGGLLDNLPVEVMLGDGEGPVVAVDVMRHPAARAPRPRRHHRGLRAPAIAETLVRASVLGSWERAAASRRAADLLVTPDVDDIGLLEFNRIDAVVAAGAAAVPSDAAAVLLGQ